MVAIYRQTILGPFWFLLQPLFSTFVFALVFGKIARISTDGMPHILFYMTGIVTWNYFAGCFSRTSETFAANAGLFGKVYFPRLAVPLSIVVVNLVAFFFQFALFLVVLLSFKFSGFIVRPNLYVLFTPLLIIQMAALALGVGLLVTSLTTRYRDLSFLMGFASQLWMYATPIVYPMSIVPDNWKWFYAINPMSSVVEMFRYAFLGSGSVSVIHVCVSIATTFVLLLAGLIVFNRTEKTFVDSI
jgi:homopolymeric O-antigen transport system permease protein